ncbi:hypothetical protein OA415_05115 [Pelagibacteraceae bacterium]|nr:hypothetical protein [Pelagibacteraceae bacterium]
MNKYLTIFFLIFSIISCGYPDIDKVPDFKETKLTREELLEYCRISNTNKKDIDKCINDYKS